MPLILAGSQDSGFIWQVINDAPTLAGPARRSCDRSHEIENDARDAARRERGNHADLEPKDRDGGRNGENESPRIDGDEIWRVERQRKCTHWHGLAKHGVDREPDGEVQDYADHRRGNGGERGIERLVAPQRLDKRRPEENPEKAGGERHPGGEQAAERSGHHGRERTGIAVRRNEAHELQHHDQRPRSGLGHSETIEHLPRLEPAVIFDRLLRDIGEYRIGAAERHHRHLAEEHGDLAEDVGAAERDKQRDDRNEPERKPNGRNGQRARDGGAGVLGYALAEHVVDDGRFALVGAMSRADLKLGEAHQAGDEADDRGAEDDDRKRNVEEEYADESDRRERDHHPVLERAFADADQGFDHDRENGSLEAEEQRDDDRDIAPGGVHVAQRHDGNDAGNDKKPAGDDAAEGAMHQPADIGRELLRLGARQQHAIVERMQEPLFRDPTLLLDQNAMHDRDLSGGTAEAQGRDT